MSSNIRSVYFNSLIHAFLPDIHVTLVSGSHLIDMSELIVKVLPGVSYRPLKILGHRLYFSFKPLFDSLFVEFILNLEFPQLSLDDSDGLLHLIVRDLGDQLFELFFDFLYEFSFFLSVHRGA